jgi:hypothetical protein
MAKLFIYGFVVFAMIATFGMLIEGENREALIIEQAIQIVEQEDKLEGLRVELRDLRRLGEWLILFKQDLPEITQLEISCMAESARQKQQEKAKHENN